MKILFFIESLRSGGKERRLVELIKGLSSDPNIKMEIALTKDEIHYKDIIDLNIPIRYLIRGKLKKDPKIFLSFFRIANKFKPDIIHVWGNLVAIYAIPAKILLRIPLINNQIADAPKSFRNTILNHKISFPFSNRIIANSRAGLKAYNAPLKKSTVIYNGFDLKRVQNLKPESEVKEFLGIQTEFIISMVASFSELKDYATYLKAANLVLEERNDVTFLCIGDGDSEAYKKMVNQKTSVNIRFLGKQNDIESIMNICNIGVLTTFTEGISNAILEFMALKKPVIVAGEGGCSELIDNNINGFLFNPGESEAIGKTIIKLLNNIEKTEVIGENAYRLVKEKFNIEEMIASFKREYHNFMI